MNHFDLTDKIIVIDQITGDGFVLDTRTNVIGDQVFTADAIAPEWLNVVISGPILYRALSAQYINMQKIIDALEKSKSSPHLITAMIKMQDALLLSQRVALEGAQAVSDAIDRERNPS